MTTSKRQCRGTTDEGKPCGAIPQFVDPETGFCPAHGPGGREEMRRRGTRGAYVRAKGEEPPVELPKDALALEDHADAKRVLEIVLRLVMQKQLSSQQAYAAIRAVEAWMKAEAEEATMEVVEDLREDVERLKEEIDKRPALRKV